MLYTSEIITFVWRSTLLCMVGVALFCGVMLVPAETARVAAEKETKVSVSDMLTPASHASAGSPATRASSGGSISIKRVMD